ncbi:MAG: GIY-YIG nuclease family protein [Proteobacteria bacterium]|nr:GIY-YIG nuclease family protein [Pseudomonadota bacterium]
MTFWAYMLQCADRTFYVGHTDDLGIRMGQHQAGTFRGYTKRRRPVELVWSQEFATREEARAAELQLKGWRRDKKLALIRGDWDAISALARRPERKGKASTSSAKPALRLAPIDLFLHPHPNLRGSQSFSFEVSARLDTSRLKLRFRLTGLINDLRVPTQAAPTRRDNLWQHTCFEAFVAFADGGYAEFNFSPSTEWAAYSFTGYRQGMQNLDTDPPSIRVKKTDHLLELTAEITAPSHPIRLGLSAVIEETDGTKSYWALRHPPGDKPDFHHPDCFALELPAAP